MSDSIRLAKDLIEKHEGRRSLAYEDHLGVLTIGVGRNLESKGLSDNEIDILLINDIVECFDDLSSFKWFADATDTQQAAFMDWRFQLGAAGIRKFKNTIRCLESGEYNQAGIEMLDSIWAKQTPNRAKEISRLVRGL
ncbi:MAG: lysozyme [Gammaproteobacteria bacterium]|nr:MAG: lysozyme [Gammaproteobacteria bacterium]